MGILKLGITWPLPAGLVRRHLASCDRILVVEDLLPFLEENLKVLAAEAAGEIGAKEFHGKRDGSLPSVGELNPDVVTTALAGLMGVEAPARPKEYAQGMAQVAAQGAPPRQMTFCPGCPHRASYWSIHNALELDGRDGFVCGDIGCYALGTMAAGFNTVKTIHAMGSGSGLASGFGRLERFGLDQPVLAVCGDSTFFPRRAGAAPG